MDEREEVAAPGSARKTVAALLALLPLAVLALPGGVELARDPEPTAAAAGRVWLLGLPALALALGAVRIVRPRGVLLWLLPASAFFLSSGSDTFEERRALLGFAAALAVTVAAVQWNEAQRRVFQTGLVLVSAAFTAVALARGSGAGWGGVLGNSGTLSQAALPGALVGALWALDERGARRALGGAALLLFLVHAWLAPVLAASLAVAAALAFTAAATRRVRGLAVAAVALAGLALPLGSATEDSAPEPAAATPGAAATGGVAVRLELWRALPGLWLSAPLRGVGPGQFRAAFPPHRSAAEIEATTHGRRLWEETEVEHAHSDWLQAPVEFGVLGGLGWWCLWALVAARAWSAARSSDATLRASAVGAVGLLAAAAVHSPLFHNPVGAWAAWALFGTLLPSGAPPVRRSTFARALPLVLLAALALPAWRFVRHGSGLARAMEEGGVEEGARRALDAAPHSPLALALTARAQAAAGEPETSAATWTTVLELRPHNLEALQQLGLLRALAGQPEGAAELWYRALELDPGHPRLLRNLARLEFDRGDPARGIAHLMTLDAAGRLEPEFARELAARELFAGHVGPALAVLALGGETLQPRPEELHAAAERLAAQGHALVADALRMAAQREWAHEHARADDVRAASVSLRQALKLLRHRGELASRRGAALVRAELAAALWLRGQQEEARATAAEIEVGLLEAANLADFAREPLRQLGIAFGD